MRLRDLDKLILNRAPKSMIGLLLCGVVRLVPHSVISRSVSLSLHVPAPAGVLSIVLRNELHSTVRSAPPVCSLLVARGAAHVVSLPCCRRACVRSCVGSPSGASDISGISGISMTSCISSGVSAVSKVDAVHVADYMRRMSVRHTEAISSMHRLLAKVLGADTAIGSRMRSLSVTSRTKSVYSTRMKMKRLGCPVEEILDLVAVRVVLSGFAADEDESLCYRLLDVVHRYYSSFPMTTKDFIAFPKPNGYRSLHTTVMVGVQAVELQIRTSAMHEVAERGTAAHVLYKTTQYGN